MFFEEKRRLEWVKSRNQKGTCTCHLYWLFCFISRAVWAHFGITRCAFSQLYIYFLIWLVHLNISHVNIVFNCICVSIFVYKKNEVTHSLYMSRINSNLHFTNFLFLQNLQSHNTINFFTLLISLSNNFKLMHLDI